MNLGRVKGWRSPKRVLPMQHGRLAASCLLLVAIPIADAFFPWGPLCAHRMSNCFEDCGIGFATVRGFQEEMHDALETDEDVVPLADDGMIGYAAYASLADKFSVGSLWDQRVELSHAKLWILASSGSFGKRLPRDRRGHCDALHNALGWFSDYHLLSMGYVQLVDSNKMNIAHLTRSVLGPLDRTILKEAVETLDWAVLLRSGWPIFLITVRIAQKLRAAFHLLQMSINPPGDTAASKTARTRSVVAVRAHLDAAIRAVPCHLPSNRSGEPHGVGPNKLRRVWKRLAAAQSAFKEAPEANSVSWAYVLLAHLENFGSLAVLQSAVGAYLSLCSRSLRFHLSADVQIVFCGLKEHVAALAALASSNGWGLRTWVVPSPRYCGLRDATKGWLDDVSDAARRARRAVLLVSPWTEHVCEEAMVGLVAALRPGLVDLTGAPTSTATGQWWWPARVVQRRNWKATFTVPVGGNVGSDGGNCFVASSTSGTRAYTSALLRRLLKGIYTNAETSSDVSLLLELDLRASELSVRAYTCWFGDVVLSESDYLQHAELFRAAALRRGVEVLLTPDAPERRFCIVYDSWTAEFLSIARGLSTPPCHLQALADGHHVLANWWSDQGEGLFSSLERSSALAIVRGGIFPWQGDVEMSFHAPYEDIREDAKRFQAFVSSSRLTDESWRLSCDNASRCYCHAKYGLFGGHLINAEVHFRGSSHFTDFPFTVRVAGATFRFGMSELDAAVQRYRPQRAFKLNVSFGLEPLQCFDQGHNACLPQCNSTWCEVLI
eukprot:TRINITY_DN30847_c0_g1_i1.p1 TRINITY_DN30847_c0_g1~~TRINITY_DN30847_c0_g1_i1.p1  ORF type:complete len:778 (-),score=79.36 TRINITY_DN30847_c0_g1_i1:16-2349(-)